MHPAPFPPGRRTSLVQMFTFRRLKAEIASVAQRFPFTIVFIGLLTLYCLSEVWDVEWPKPVEIAAPISLSLGTLLSLAAYLWSEFLRAGRYSLISQCSVLVLSIANFIYLYMRGNYLSLAEGVGYSAAYTALLVAIFFVPVVKRSSIKLQWTYSVAMLGALSMFILMALILSSFVGAVYGTVTLLFGFSSFKVYLSLSILLGVALPILISLCYIPDYDSLDTHIDEVNKSAISVFCKNVLLPLALAYTFILYIYGLKILITFKLPDGYVSWMVICLVSAVLLIVYGLQGYLCHADSKESTKRLAALSIRVLPAMLLPLLVLMSVAIFYRIGEYGITAKRLYVATFNVWAYFVVAYLLLSKLPKLNLVASSFAIIFLLTSVIPGFNYCTIGLNSVRASVKQRLVAIGADNLPMSYNELVDILNTQTRDVASDIATDLEFLDDWDNHAAVNDIVVHDKRIMAWRLLDAYSGTPSRSFNISVSESIPANIPSGYTTVERIVRSYYGPFASTDGRYAVELDDSTKVSIPLDSLYSLGDSIAYIPIQIPFRDGLDNVFLLTGYELSGNMNDDKPYSIISVKGYLFGK